MLDFIKCVPAVQNTSASYCVRHTSFIRHAISPIVSIARMQKCIRMFWGFFLFKVNRNSTSAGVKPTSLDRNPLTQIGDKMLWTLLG